VGQIRWLSMKNWRYNNVLQINCGQVLLWKGIVSYGVIASSSISVALLKECFFLIKLESFGSHYIKADEKMDIYARVIVEVNNLSKVFNSMGLTMWFEPYHLINTGGVSFRLYKTIKE
jgi:hypothetical protein